MSTKFCGDFLLKAQYIVVKITKTKKIEIYDFFM